jgi:hypothetical protein
MAYKFQLGSAQMSGALVQEGAIKLHNQAGSEVASVKQDGVLSGSGAGKFSTLSIDSVQVFSAAQQLQAVASLDATTEATIEGAIDTLANLSSAGSTGVDLDVLGPLDVQEGIKQNGTEILSDAGALKAIASVSGSGAFQGGSAAFGTSVTAGTSFIIGSADLNEADLEKLDGITNGTVAASKAVVVDANKDAAGFRDVSGRTVSGSGNATFMGNYVGGGSVTAGSSFIIGSADLNETDLEKLDGITNGTVAAGKAVVVSSDKDASGFRNITGTGAITAGTSFVIGSADLNEADMEKLDGITNGTAAASKALVLDASRNITNIYNLTASYFKGDGSGLTNVDAVTNVSASSANVQYELAFTEYLGSDVELGGNVGLSYNPSARSLFLSGSSAGKQSSEIVLGNASSKQGRIYVDDDGGYALSVISAGGIDLSGSDGITAMMPNGTFLNVASEFENSGLKLVDFSGNASVQLKRDGSVSGSDAGKFKKLHVNSTQVFSDALQLQAVASLDATTEATIEAAIDTLANLASMGSNGSELEALGSLDVAQTFKIANSQLSDASKNLTAAGVSGSGNFSIGGTLSADNLASVTVDLTADMMVIDDGASGAIKITSLSSYATALAAGSNEGLKSTAGRLQVDLDDLSAASVSVANDSIALIDADDSNATKKESIADLVTAMAGAGLTATNGVLSTQSGVVALIADGGTLTEGYNYLADISSNATVTLPASPSVGDVVHVKAADLNSGANVIISKAGSQTIDDDHTSIRIESSFGAVSLVYVVSNKWRLV